MKFTLPSDPYTYSQLTTRSMLKQSKNPEIRILYEATAPKNIEADTLLHQDKPKNRKDRLVNKTVNKILDNMKGVKEQNTINVHVVPSISGRKFVKDFHKTSSFSSVKQQFFN